MVDTPLENESEKGAGMPRLFTAVVMTTMTCPMLAACLSEESPPLEAQPLEVVVASRTAEEPCLLNVTMVRAGDHEVSIISERGPSQG